MTFGFLNRTKPGRKSARRDVWTLRVGYVVWLWLSAAIVAHGYVLAAEGSQNPAAGDTVSFEAGESSLEIRIGEQPIATYVYRDENIPRPYFAHVRAASGIQVTRNHPPVEGKDHPDHATFHPGIWLAFGDISGADFWRNRAAIRHVRFVDAPKGGSGRGSFAVLNRYEAAGKTICDEICRFTFVVRPAGYFLIWDSRFSNDAAEFVFGDQEEMGLGVRVATPITVERGGEITNSEGLRNEEQAWGKEADWCDYSGVVDDKRIGVTLMPYPDNFRRCWFHVRDYGLLLANPFGRNAFTKGEKSRVIVATDESLRLRFGVFIYAANAEARPNLSAAYQDFLTLTEEPGTQ